MMEMMMGALMGGAGGMGMMLGGKGQKKGPKGAKGAQKGPKGPPPQAARARSRRDEEFEEEEDDYTDDFEDDDGDEEDEAGYFGIAVTRDQRIRKNMDRLYRLTDKFQELAAKIEETEDKLESFGVDVQELYESWELVEPDEAYDGIAEGMEEDEEEYEEDDYEEGFEGDGGAGGGGVIGHIDDLSDEELEALQSGELTLDDLGVGEAALDFDEDEEPADIRAESAQNPARLFPPGTTSGRGFKEVTRLGNAPWIARGKFASTSKQGIASPIGAFAAEARRSLLNSASRGTDEPVWVYQQTMGQKAIMYYVAIGEDVPAPLLQKWNQLPGYGQIKLVGTANGAASAHTGGSRSRRAV